MWRMIWEQNVSCVIMLTLLTEKNMREKCHCYWPEPVNSSKCYGCNGLIVRLVSETTLNAFTVRVMEMSMGDQIRTVTQLHYLKWEDFNVPDMSELWQLLKSFRDYTAKGVDAPIVVHCSAGVGRTGTFIVLDWVINELLEGATSISVPHYILKLRSRRRFMVQSFVSRVLHTRISLECGHNNIVCFQQKQLGFIYLFLSWFIETELPQLRNKEKDENLYVNCGKKHTATIIYL